MSSHAPQLPSLPKRRGAIIGRVDAVLETGLVDLAGVTLGLAGNAAIEWVKRAAARRDAANERQAAVLREIQGVLDDFNRQWTALLGAIAEGKADLSTLPVTSGPGRRSQRVHDADTTGSRRRTPARTPRGERAGLRALLIRAGVAHMAFHSARHSADSLLLGRGVHPKIVSEMLGHSTVAITLDVYSHVTPAMHREAGRVMDELLTGG